jgi:SAM-dependent methyltransferase
VKQPADFDGCAEDYEERLNSCLGPLGGKDDYFHRQKLGCLKRWITGVEPGATILDFGCGIGNLTGLTAQAFPRSTVYGYDVSRKCIEAARKKWGHLGNLTFSNDPPSKGSCQLIIAANVFHHIKPSDRIGELLQLKDILKTGRNIVIFEHNPLNPLTRQIVRACPFDREAELISLSRFLGLAYRSGLRVRLKRYTVFFFAILEYFQRS